MIDIGQVGTEMLYWLVGSRELDGGLMCTASHNPKAYTGAKLVRRGAIPLSGDAGIQDIRREIENGHGPRRPPGGGTSEKIDVYPQVPAGGVQVHRRRQVKPLKVVVDGGNGMAGPDDRPAAQAPPARPRRPTFCKPDGEFPGHEPNPLLPENREFIIARSPTRARTSGSRGTATPTAASSSTTRARSSTATS